MVVTTVDVRVAVSLLSLLFLSSLGENVGHAVGRQAGWLPDVEDANKTVQCRAVTECEVNSIIVLLIVALGVEYIVNSNHGVCAVN